MDASKFCEVCGSSAVKYHYGVLTCNSCKMFFRRHTIHPTNMSCRGNLDCYVLKRTPLAPISTNRGPRSPVNYCRFCRFEKCKAVGMRLTRSKEILELENKSTCKYADMITFLLHHDAIREQYFNNKSLPEDMGLDELVVRKKSFRFERRDMTRQMRPMDWCYMHSVLSVYFFNALPVFYQLESKDKIILSKNFHLKAAKMFYALDAKNSRRDIIVTPDNQELYPEFILEFPLITYDFFLDIRYKLLNQFIAFGVTREEVLLILVIFFCDPGLDGLSDYAKTELQRSKDEYGAALLDYCRSKYQNMAYSRYLELLSIYYLIKKDQEEINHLLNVFQMCIPDYFIQELLKTF